MKSRLVAGLLAIFLGSFGAHKFYLKDPGSGVFYLMLTIFGSNLGFPIGSILGFIDAFVLLTTSQEKFDAKYNSGNQNQGNRRRRPNRQDPRQRQRQTYEPRQRQTRRQDPYRQNSRVRQEPIRKKRVVRDNPFKSSGLKRLQDYELDLAEVELTKGLELSPDDMAIHYGLAKVYSLTEQKNKSFYHISKAVQLGFKDTSKIKTDDELAYLRIQPEFEEFEKTKFMYPPNTPKQAPTNTQQSDKDDNKASVPPADDLLQDDMLLSQLNKLAELRKKGLLSEREFEEEKIKLLRR